MNIENLDKILNININIIMVTALTSRSRTINKSYYSFLAKYYIVFEKVLDFKIHLLA